MRHKGQTPELSISYFGKFYLHAPSNTLPEQPRQPSPAAVDSVVDRDWLAVQNSTSIAIIQEFRRQHPNSNYDPYAAARIDELRKLGGFGVPSPGPATSSAVTTPDPCAAASDHWRSVETINDIRAYTEHIVRFPNCAFVPLAKARIEALQHASIPPAGHPATPLPKSPEAPTTPSDTKVSPPSHAAKRPTRPRSLPDKSPGPQLTWPPA